MNLGPKREAPELFRARTDDGWSLALHHYRARGPVRGRRPVVLCHGMGSNRFSFDAPRGPSLARYLSALGFDVWCVEMRGAGQSARPHLFNRLRWEWSFEEHVAKDAPAALRVVLTESRARSLHWVGHSLGGMVAYALLARDEPPPIHSAVAIAAPMVEFFPPPPATKLVRRVLERMGRVPAGTAAMLGAPLAGLLYRMSFFEILYNPANMDAATMRRALRCALDDVPARLLLDYLRAFENRDNGGDHAGHSRPFAYERDLHKIQKPLLLVGGARDGLCPPRDLYTVYQRVRSRTKRVEIMGRDNGCRHDYGHHDLLIGKSSEREVYPMLATWLLDRDEDEETGDRGAAARRPARGLLRGGGEGGSAPRRLSQCNPRDGRATGPPMKRRKMSMEALRSIDPDVYDLIRAEERRQADTVRLIPSENYVSRAVLEASGTVLTNKYSEGYAGKRYYEGQDIIDPLEELCVSRAKSLFGAEHANVQPYSGSPANLAVYLAFAKPGDTVMGQSLPHGGHLTHGWNVSVTGIYFRSAQYVVRRDTGRLDYDEIRELARRERPRLLFAGATAYPRLLDFEAFASIAREVGAIFVADMAHIAGLVAGGVHPSPIPHADVVTTTTHKTLRGPRAGMILCKAEHAKAIDRAVFPGLQGGPHNHTTAAVAVALREAASPEFRAYAARIVENARVLAAGLLARGFDLVSGGTDNHLILIDLTRKGVTGKQAAKALAKAGIETNYNTVPFDPRKPFDPSGLRIGSPACTSRGMGAPQMERIAEWIERVVANVGSEEVLARVREETRETCRSFPAPGLAL